MVTCRTPDQVGSFDPIMLLAFAAAFIIGGTIKGTVGIGLPTAVVGILTLFVAPREAMALLLLPIMVTNFWQAYRSGHILRTLRRYAVFNAALIIFMVATTSATASISNSVLLTVLGLVVVFVALTGLFLNPPALPARFDQPAQLLSGAASGILGGLTTIWAPTMVTYLLSKRLDKDEFVRASGVIISVGSIPLVGGFYSAGLFTGPLAVQSLLMVAPTLAGFQFGELIRRRFDAVRFRSAVLIVFLMIGLNLLRRTLLA